jgi:hypothetical protein
LLDLLAGDWIKPGQADTYSPPQSLPKAGKAPRYPCVERFTDALRGYRDGRAGLPSDASAMPAYVQFLVQQGRYMVELERIRFEANGSGLRSRLAEIELMKVAMREAVKATAERLRILREAPAETTRRIGEQRTPDAIVQRRRLREHSREIASGEDAFNAAYEQLTRLELEAATVRERLWQRQLSAALNAKRIHRYTLNRIDTYMRRLLRVHPEGRHLNVLMPDRPSLERELGDQLFTYDHAEWEQWLYRDYAHE